MTNKKSWADNIMEWVIWGDKKIVPLPKDKLPCFTCSEIGVTHKDDAGVWHCEECNLRVSAKHQ